MGMDIILSILICVSCPLVEFGAKVMTLFCIRLHSKKHDLNSVTGQNVGYLLGKFNKSSLKSLVNSKNEIKTKAVYHLPEHEKWKVNLISEISLVKKEHLDLNFDDEDLEEILEYICTK